MRKPFRLFTLLTVVVLLAAFGCRRGQPETTEEPTDEPSPTPGVESIGEFQLVGSVQQALLSIGPDIEIPFEADSPPLEEGTAGRVKPAVGGAMRVALEAFSDNMRDRCAADTGDKFNIFWTTDTLFDEALLGGADVEAGLDGRTLGIIGTVFLKPTGLDTGDDTGGLEELDPGADTPSPTAPQATSTPNTSPGLTEGEGETDCVLRAEQVGTSQGALPSPRPTARAGATATPTTRPAPTRTPTPTPPRTPTPSPAPTATPTATPTPTASPTPTPSPTST